MGGQIQDETLNFVLVLNGRLLEATVTALGEQQVKQQECRSLVSVGKAVVVCDRLQKHRRLLIYVSVVAAVRTCNGSVDPPQILNTTTAARRVNGSFVSCDRVSYRDSVVEHLFLGKAFENVGIGGDDGIECGGRSGRRF